MIIVDNGSVDDTLEILSRLDDALVLVDHGNLGYAGGINVASRYVGRTGGVLVLNPDLRIDPDCVPNLLLALRTTGAGVVVPRIFDEAGKVYPSLRREPSVFRAFGDALLGSRLPGRPAWLSEIDHQSKHYETGHSVDWATGAALLIAADVFREVGDWQEKFFLYSEETDFFRRAREAGHTVHFEPSAIVHHRQGGSGRSTELTGTHGCEPCALRRVASLRDEVSGVPWCSRHGRTYSGHTTRSTDALFERSCIVSLGRSLPHQTPKQSHCHIESAVTVHQEAL